MKSELSDSAFEQLVRRTLTDVAASTPVDGPRVETASKTTLGHRVMSVAAAVMLLAGGVGIAYAMSRQSEPASTADQPVQQSRPALVDFSHSLVPAVLPDDYVVYTGAVTDGRVERNPGVEWTFGRPDEQGAVSPAIRLTIAPTEGGFCPFAESESIAVGDYPAALCTADSNDLHVPFRSASWVTIGGVDLNVVVDATVDVSELVAFAAALDSETIGSAVTRDLVYDSELAAKQTPPGWELLADDALLSTYGAREADYIVGQATKTDASLDYIQVRTWTGAPPSAIYAIGFPLAATPTEVHGQPALLVDREPDNQFLFWVEADGTIVSVQAIGEPAASIVEFSEALITADRQSFDDFVADAVDPPIQLPRDEPANTAGVDD